MEEIDQPQAETMTKDQPRGPASFCVPYAAINALIQARADHDLEMRLAQAVRQILLGLEGAVL